MIRSIDCSCWQLLIPFAGSTSSFIIIAHHRFGIAKCRRCARSNPFEQQNLRRRRRALALRMCHGSVWLVEKCSFHVHGKRWRLLNVKRLGSMHFLIIQCLPFQRWMPCKHANNPATRTLFLPLFYFSFKPSTTTAHSIRRMLSNRPNGTK